MLMGECVSVSLLFSASASGCMCVSLSLCLFLVCLLAVWERVLRDPVHISDNILWLFG